MSLPKLEHLVETSPEVQGLLSLPNLNISEASFGSQKNEFAVDENLGPPKSIEHKR